METGIYSIKNTVNGKCYVGSTTSFSKRMSEHFRTLENGKHINCVLQSAYDKYGKDSFVFLIMETVEDISILRDREQYWMDTLDSNCNRNGYNISDAYKGGDLLSGHPNKKEIRRRISETAVLNAMNMTLSERQKKWGKPGERNGMYGKTHTEEARKKISEATKGNTRTRGRKASEETKKKLSEHAKTRTGEKNPFYGRTHSEETKKKLSDSNKGKIPANSKKVIAEGKEFESATECGRFFGIATATVLYRIKSDNYDYRYL